MIVSQNDYGRKADASCWGVPAPNPARNEYDKLGVVYFFFFGFGAGSSSYIA